MNLKKLNLNHLTLLEQSKPIEDFMLLDGFINQEGLMEVDSEGDVQISNNNLDLFLELDENSDIQFRGV